MIIISMDTEDMRDAITLLEEVVNSNIFDVKKINIKSDKIIKSISKRNIQTGGNIDETTDTDTTENSSVTGDSVSVGHIGVPSEIFVVYKKEKKLCDSHSNSHNSSHCNLAFSNGSKNVRSDNDLEEIVNYKEKIEK